MVHNLLQLIEDNTDKQTLPSSSPSVINFICGNNITGLTFDYALI